MTENDLARISHEEAVWLAKQAIADAAVWLVDHAFDEHGETVIVPLGAVEDLSNTIDAWRALGGQTTEEFTAETEDHYFSKGTTLPAKK